MPGRRLEMFHVEHAWEEAPRLFHVEHSRPRLQKIFEKIRDSAEFSTRGSGARCGRKYLSPFVSRGYVRDYVSTEAAA